MACGISRFDPARRPGPLAQISFWLGRQWYRSRLLTRLWPDHPRLVSLLRGAAEANHVAALALLGHILALRGVTAGDKALGFEYLRRAAELGDAGAGVFLARAALASGHGAAGTPAIALNDRLRWLSEACEAGHPLAEELLARTRANA